MAFGKPIGQMQAVQHMIADTYAGLETRRLLTYRAAWLHALDRPCGIESTMAKLVASEHCFAGADRGMQVLGGYGYALEYDMQRYWRDMRLYRVAPINNEMARNYARRELRAPPLLLASYGTPRHLLTCRASSRRGAIEPRHELALPVSADMHGDPIHHAARAGQGRRSAGSRGGAPLPGRSLAA